MSYEQSIKTIKDTTTMIKHMRFESGVQHHIIGELYELHGEIEKALADFAMMLDDI